MRRLKKLLPGQHRYHGKTVKPKDQKKWKEGKEYDRKERVWVSFKDQAFKKKMLSTFETASHPRYKYGKIDEKNGKQQRSLLGIKGYDNMHFKRDLDSSLKDAKVNYEGNGWYQLNAYTGATKQSAPVKIRYNPSQKSLEVYIRDWKVNTYTK